MTKHLLKLIWARKRSNALLIAEVFFSFLVLFAVAVAALYFLDNQRHPIGFTYDDVWIVGVNVQSEWGAADDETMQQVLLAARQTPGVETVARAVLVPYIVARFEDRLAYHDRSVTALNNRVSDDYLDAMGLKLTRGRWFMKSDEALHWTPVVITELLQRQLFGIEDPLGRRIKSSFRPQQDLRVVGVVEAYREEGEYAARRGYMFRRAHQDEHDLRNIVVEARSGAGIAFEERLVERLHFTAPTWSFDVHPLAEMRAGYNRYRLLGVQAAGLVAVFLMLMVAFGLSGVLWQNVTRRTGEFGLRRAVGGTAGSVRGQVLLELALVVSIGIAVGSVLVLQAPLLGLLGFIEPYIFAGALVTSLLVIYLMALAAGLYPSWLATRIHPASALHHN